MLFADPELRIELHPRYLVRDGAHSVSQNAGLERIYYFFSLRYCFSNFYVEV